MADKYALVTGGASGIGRATCIILARDYGFAVAVADRDLDGAQRVAAECGGRAVQVDVTDEGSVIEGFAAAQSAFNLPLMGLVTAAGMGESTPFMELTPAIFRRTNDVNVIGTFLCMREAANRMPAGARICAIASVAGKRGGGLLGTGAYAASKGGVIALARNAARSLADRGIVVNCVAPANTDTPMYLAGPRDVRERAEALTLLKRSAQPEELAEAVAWITSPKASFVAGETLTVDGGLQLD